MALLHFGNLGCPETVGAGFETGDPSSAGKDGLRARRRLVRRMAVARLENDRLGKREEAIGNFDDRRALIARSPRFPDFIAGGGESRNWGAGF